jgi:hypothetical protein
LKMSSEPSDSRGLCPKSLVAQEAEKIQKVPGRAEGLVLPQFLQVFHTRYNSKI